MLYPYLELPWETNDKVWIHGSQYKDDHYGFTLSPEQADLLLIMGLARQGNLGTLNGGALSTRGITLKNDGWLSFSGASNALVQGLDQSLNKHRNAFLQLRPLLRALNQPLLDNNNVDWRLSWTSQQICFSPSAFQGSFRLNDLQDCNSGGVLTIEMKPTHNVIFAPRQPLYAANITSAAGRALLFMNMNPLEIGAPYVFRSAVEDFCVEIYATLGGNYMGQALQVRNNPILLIQQILNQASPQAIQKLEAALFKVYNTQLQLQQKLLNQFNNAFTHMPKNTTWIINSLIGTVQKNLEDGFTKFWNEYVLLISDILALIIARYNNDMLCLLQGSQLNATILSRQTVTVRNLMNTIAVPPRNPADFTYLAVEKRTNTMQNNPLPDNFRSTLNHNQSIQNIRQYGCYNFYDYKKYGHTGGWYLYYLIDFRVGCGANDECVLPFYAEPGHVRSLCLPSDSKAISAAVYTLLEIPEDNNNNILLFMVNQKSACNEDDGGIFENILCWPLSQGCLSPNDLLLSQKSSIAVHSGSRTTGGYVVVTN